MDVSEPESALVLHSAFTYLQATNLLSLALLYVPIPQAAAAAGKQIWQSEWGPLAMLPTDVSDMELALVLARSICEHINFLGVVAWSHWQAVDSCWDPHTCARQQWGLVRILPPCGAEDGTRRPGFAGRKILSPEPSASKLTGGNQALSGEASRDEVYLMEVSPRQGEDSGRNLSQPVSAQSEVTCVGHEEPSQTSGRLFLSKQYFATLHFSRWIPHGAKIYRIKGSAGQFVCTAVNQRENQFVVVVANQEKMPVVVWLRHPLPEAACSPWRKQRVHVRKYRTSTAEDHVMYESTTLPSCPPVLTMWVAPMSIVTVVLRH